MKPDFTDSVFAHTSTRVRGVSSRRVAMGLLVLALVPLLLVLLVAWEAQRRSLVERAEHDMAAWASLQAASQEQALEGTRQLLVAVSSTRAVVAADWPACNGFLQRLAGKFPHYVSIGVIALADFIAPNGLKQIGNANWEATGVSGAPTYGQPSTSQYGTLLSGAVERSNVDISEELVGLITAQRYFQANAKAIDTATQISQTIINLRT